MDEFKIGAPHLTVFAAAAMPGPCAVFAASRTASGGSARRTRGVGYGCASLLFACAGLAAFT